MMQHLAESELQARGIGYNGTELASKLEAVDVANAAGDRWPTCAGE